MSLNIVCEKDTQVFREKQKHKGGKLLLVYQKKV